MILPFVYLPILAGLLLAGIHAYLGVVVVDRGEIFASLALAQLAAFGSALAMLLGADEHGIPTYLLAFGFALLGAAIFALTRDRRVARETIAAIVYAVAAAATILVVTETVAADVRDAFIGDILSVSAHTVAKTAVVFALAALFHFFVLRPRPRDFLFHALFGLVVTASLTFAGVLLVFAYLTVPAVAATLFAQTPVRRLAIGWTLGAIVTVIGVILAFKADLPTGATIICTFGIALLVAALVRVITRRTRPDEGL